jgi:hypothetical protein
MNDTRQEVLLARRSAAPELAPLARRLLMVFWMVLGAATGIKIVLVLWHLFTFDVGELTIAVPVGGVVGGRIGICIGSVGRPRWLVLLMAVLAGSLVGAVAGNLSWTEIGEISGYVIGGVVGAIIWVAWVAWLFIGRGKMQR